MKIIDLIRETLAEDKPLPLGNDGDTSSEIVLLPDGKVWVRGRIFGRNPPKGSYRYIIIHDKWTERTSFTYQYNHREAWQELKLQLRYKLMCPLGKAEIAAQSFRRSNVQNRIERKFQECIHRYLGRTFDGFAQDIVAGCRELESELVQSLVEFGLDAEITVELQQRQETPIVPLELKAISIRCTDYDYDLVTDIRFEIKEDARQPGLAMLTSLDSQQFGTAAKVILLEQFKLMTLQQFLEAAMGDGFDAACRALTAALSGRGRLVDRIDVRLPEGLDTLLRNGIQNTTIHCTANDLPGECKLNLEIAYWGRASSSNFAKAAKALGLQPNHERIGNWIRQLLAEYWSGQLPRIREFLAEFFISTRILGEYMEAEIASKTGMQIKITVKVLDLAPQPPIRIPERRILARPFDLEHEISIQYSATVEVSPNHLARAVAFGAREEALIARLETSMRNIVSSDISAHSLYLQRDAAIQLLRRACGENLLEVGYHLTSLEVLPLTGGTWSPSYSGNDIEIRVSYRGSERELVIFTNLEMTLVNLGAFMRRDPGDLEAWVQATITSATRDVLLAEGYAAFVAERTKFLESIKARITDEFAKAGYKVTQFISTPQIDFDSLNSPFELSQEHLFKTKYNHIEVSLTYKVRAKISDLKRVKELIDLPGSTVTTIHDAIMARVTKSMAIVLEKREAEQVFFFWDQPFEKAQNEVLKDVLLNGVIKELTENDPFGLKDLDINIDIGRNGLRERFKDLRRESVSHQFTYVAARTTSYGERFTIDLTFHIDSVLPEGWDKFHLHSQLGLNHHRELIGEEVEKGIKAWLNQYDFESILDPLTKRHGEVIDTIKKIAVNTLKKNFGLGATVTAFISDIGGNSIFSEKLRKAQKTKVTQLLDHQSSIFESDLASKEELIVQLRSAIKTLEDKRLKLLSLPPDLMDSMAKDELDDLDERIPKLRAELDALRGESKNPLSGLPQSPKPLLPPPIEPTASAPED